mmetsp:Transcript_24046/g.32869  ORF Transcript_24046/g.32869 Transcript_24046/m.32869 type:complete len:258 (-) Transcript_24046:51-824(-)|eukprot:CAMPEP_0185756106 /NCGR_PEP_ID=MMETSP1174-20130828/14547_1 /TAXON_ID=35687 /ORGANISM="Dictyocha speculum, Strain CCMP1381" /LENGTH=257 /DNA_ID=CAMNT_0028434923 /DNA_START=113 /DNA_END=886 /DNA_ORIENTATION=-
MALKLVAVALALIGGNAFTPVSHGVTTRWNTRLSAEEAAAPAAEAVVEEVAEPEPEPPAPPKQSAREYLETMYGGIGEPETGKKIPPLAYAIADAGTPATMDFFRAAELKHGRIAMVGFMGWVAHFQHITFPGYLSASAGITFADMDKLNPIQAFFESTPLNGLGQIFFFCAVLEWYEMTHQDGKWFGNNVLSGNVRPNINKWDILGFTEDKDENDPVLMRAKLQELKNGRLAMMGTLGCCAAASIPGSVPFLTNLF